LLGENTVKAANLTGFVLPSRFCFPQVPISVQSNQSDQKKRASIMLLQGIPLSPCCIHPKAKTARINGQNWQNTYLSPI